MRTREEVISGRKYEVKFSEDDQSGAYVIVGPPEGFVDELGLPEPLATNLHNAMYSRRIFTYKDAARDNAIMGAWKEVLEGEVHRLVEIFASFERTPEQ
jgi:hypothetical protein